MRPIDLILLVLVVLWVVIGAAFEMLGVMSNRRYQRIKPHRSEKYRFLLHRGNSADHNQDDPGGA
jgi:hypothetical protein